MIRYILPLILLSLWGCVKQEQNKMGENTKKLLNIVESIKCDDVDTLPVGCKLVFQSSILETDTIAYIWGREIKYDEPKNTMVMAEITGRDTFFYQYRYRTENLKIFPELQFDEMDTMLIKSSCFKKIKIVDIVALHPKHN